MRAGISKPMILVVISVLVVGLVYSSISAFNALAVPSEAPSDADCWTQPVSNPATGYIGYITTCCWFEADPGDPEGIELEYCQGCSGPTASTTDDCNPKTQQGPSPPPSGPLAPLQGGVLEQPPTPPPSDTVGPLKGGILEQLEQGDGTPGFMPGFLERQQLQPPADEEGATGSLPPVTEETGPTIVQEQDEQPPPAAEEPATAEEQEEQQPLITCPGGLVLDEETNLCVLEEQPEESDEGQQAFDGGEPEAIEEPQQDEGQSSEENSDN